MYNKKMLPLLLLPFLGITALVLLAIGNVLLQSLGYIPAFGLDEPTLQYYQEVFLQEEFAGALLVSLRIAFWSAVLACILGVLLCFALVQCRQTHGPLFYLIRLPILTPHAVVAVFVVNLLSQTGLLRVRPSRWADQRLPAVSPAALHLLLHRDDFGLPLEGDSLCGLLCAGADVQRQLYPGGGGGKSGSFAGPQLF